MLWNRFVVGYHGCDATLARNVVCKKTKLLPSINDYDWLGTGIYFWEGSPERALQWAEDAARQESSKIKKPGVLGAVIDLGNCLNLVEAEYLEIVRNAYLSFKAIQETSGTPMPQNSGKNMALRKLDKAVFDSLHHSRKLASKPEFDTVRAFFVEGTELYPNAGIRDMDHIQICVRNSQQFIGLFLP